MFAFAVWDAESQELVLVRDRMGIKPLYYARLPDGAVFGSEPKAILAHPQVAAELDAEGIAERQLVADVPLCTLLSGGLASSTLTAMAAGSVRRHGGNALATFSVDFAGRQHDFRPDRLPPSHDEPYARRVAEHVGSRHRTILLDAADLAGSQWEPLAARDLPATGEEYISAYLLFRAVREHAVVALSGESADEVFGGYLWYYDEAMLAAPTYPWAAGGSWAPLLRPEVAAGARLDEYAADRYADARVEVPRLDRESHGEARIREVLYHGLTRWLPLLLDRKDRLSMAVGLEVRVPFCDHRLVEYVWNVPWLVKETGGIEKGLLRKAVADLLPAEVVCFLMIPQPPRATLSPYMPVVTSLLNAFTGL